MKLMNILKKFSKDEAGAVTVDWVVLTAAIVGLGLVVMQTVSGGLTDAADSIVADLDERQFDIIRWFSWNAQHLYRHGGALFFEYIVRRRFGLGEPDQVAVDAALISLESDKAAMDVPSPVAGTVVATGTATEWAAGIKITVGPDEAADAILEALTSWGYR